MKYFPALMAVAVLGAAACGPGVKLPPVSPEEVEVFMPGMLPREDYKVLARIMESRPLNTPDQEMIDLAKAKAAELGADALVIDAIRRTTEGGIQTDLRQEELKIIEARAVYYPSKHPELSEQKK
jgi:hypothetical protein